jgi:hypothetical protein
MLGKFWIARGLRPFTPASLAIIIRKFGDFEAIEGEIECGYDTNGISCFLLPFLSIFARDRWGAFFEALTGGATTREIGKS